LGTETQNLFESDRFKQSLFGALNFGLGYKDTDDFDTCCSGLNSTSYSRSGGVVAADGFVGYQMEFGKIQASLRYRFQIISQGGFNLSQPTFIHGPELTVTIPLN
jgi:hypothetical protein